MTFRGEVDDGARLMLIEERGHQGLIADISVDKAIAWVGLDALQVAAIPGIGEQVEINDSRVSVGKPLQDEVGADEPRAAGNKNDVVHRKIRSTTLIAG